MYLKEKNMPHLFVPHLFGSQQCEKFFRQIRSFTTTYSTVANCSVKEILGRISKIQLLNEILYNNSSNFKFPSLGTHEKYPCAITLPTMAEIHDEVLKCKNYAIQDALKIGLIEQRNVKRFDFSCKVNPYTEVSTKKNRRSNKPQLSVIHQPKRIIQLKNIALKNFADKFLDKNVVENCPFVEVYSNSIKRIVVKKTSFCWMLRNDYAKLSSDRLERVKDIKRAKKKRKFCTYYPVKEFKAKKIVHK